MNATLLREMLASVLLTLALAMPAQASEPSLVPPTERYAGKTHAQWLESRWT